MCVNEVMGMAGFVGSWSTDEMGVGVPERGRWSTMLVRGAIPGRGVLEYLGEGVALLGIGG